MASLRRLHSPARAAVALAAAASVAVAGISAAVAEMSVGDRAAEFRGVVDAGGEAVALRAQRGKVVVVTFGASWCAPCKRELPALERLASRYAGKGVSFIAVNIDRDRATGRRFMSEFSFEHVRAAFDPKGTTAQAYGPPAMPSTYIIDKRGLVRAVHPGYRPGDERKIAKVVNGLL